VTASSNRYSGVCIDTGRDTTLTLRELLPPNELPPPLDPPTG
jgi:hypothetical protein